MKIEELTQEQMEQISGGKKTNRCHHPHKYKTGNQREDSRFIFWSQHQFEYFCPDCERTFWTDEEP